MPSHVFTATEFLIENLDVLRKNGHQRVNLIEGFLQELVESNTALTGGFIYLTKINPTWRGYADIRGSARENSHTGLPRRNATQLFQYKDELSDESERDSTESLDPIIPFVSPIRALEINTRISLFKFNPLLR
jgi:hypothetical protein